MKKIILITLVALFAATTTQAKTEQNPKGLYRLKQFIYEDGSTAPPNKTAVQGVQGILRTAAPEIQGLY